MNIKSLGEEHAFDYKLKTLVIGLGLSGYSCVEFLADKNCPFDVCDTRENPPNVDNLKRDFPRLDLIKQEINRELLANYQQLVVSPGISIRQQVFKDFQRQGKLLIGDVELFAQELNRLRQNGDKKVKVIAITGSNGKSTVTTMVAHIAQFAGIKTIAGGNLGLPVLSILNTDAELYVLELSSFQLETLNSLVCESAVVLNVSEDHMDRYEDIEDYQKVKEKIYQHAKLKVFNLDESFARSLKAKLTQSEKKIGFSLGVQEERQFGLTANDMSDSANQEYLTQFSSGRPNKILAVSELKVRGRHNVSNALAALALLEPWQISSDVIGTALQTYTGLPHRCEWVRELNGINFYNDSKGTNVGASIAAIEGFSEALVLIAGGIGKGADFGEFATIVCKKITTLVLFGQDANLIADAIKLKKEHKQLEMLQVDNLKQAVISAYEKAKPGMTVLFSPACASFDQYENYVLRGEDFIKQVNALA